MGNFANSLHVRSDDTSAVTGVLQRILESQGLDRVEGELAGGARRGAREIRLAESNGGWVSLIDSDMAAAMFLAESLSRELNAYSIWTLVNDSDSWNYLLYHEGRQIDEFDSSGGDLDDDDEDTEFPAAGGAASGGFWQMQSQLIERATRLAKELEEGMPPDIREIRDRLKTSGPTAPGADRYAAWVQSQMSRIKLDLSGVVGTGPFSMAPVAGAIDREKINRHAQILEPLYAPGVTRRQVAGVMEQGAVFAEELLAEFLPLIGIRPIFAQLSSGYLSDFSPTDLTQAGVEFVEHLRFKR